MVKGKQVVRMHPQGSVMNIYLVLFCAIAFEVLGTMLLPTTQGFTKTLPSLFVVGSYVISFYLLSIAVEKLPLAIVYASWAGIGVFTVAILSYFLYKQTLNWQTVTGLIFIVFGVALVNIYKPNEKASNPYQLSD